MHRIDGPGHVGNRFSPGNPQQGQQATVVTADWMNDIQENNLHVLDQAEILPVKGKVDQLYLAIVKIAAGASGVAAPPPPVPPGSPPPPPPPPSEPAVPTTRQVRSAGLVTGGGTLANDLELTVGVATPAEAAAGVRNDVALTPYAAAAAAGALLQTNGYVRLPGGVVVQWGQGTATSNATTVITLPTTFPNACLFAGCSGGASNNNAQDNNPTVVGRGQGSISIYSALDGGTPVNWFAWGY